MKAPMPSWCARRKDFLGGKSSAVQQEIEVQMKAAAEALDFESAAMLRDRLRAATFIQGSQAINAAGVGEADIFAMARKGGQVAIQAFFIRGGQNWGHRAFFPAHTEEVAEEAVLSGVLAQFYEEVPPPRLVLVDRELPDAALLSEAFGALSGHGVAISVPQRGDRRRLVEQAARNAVEALDRRLAESGTKAQDPARAGRIPRTGRCAAADRDLRQQPYPGHQGGGRDGGRRAGGLPQEPVSQIQHQERPD